MPSPILQHPSPEQLAAFSQGRVGTGELAEIQAHLDTCPTCLAALAGATDDPFLDRLRHAAHRPPADGDRTTSADPAPADAPDPAAPVPSVPGYEILGELGRGGMGVVYKARHLGLNRLVALKVLLAGAHAGPEALVRFRAEAEAVARLRHPNVVQVYDLGSHAGLPYFALELCPGGTLAQHSGGRPQPPRAAAALVETLARALACAHSQGIVHRDLKPSNVLLDAGGAVKVADFGLAKWMTGEGGLTGTGAAVGTPSYMAPEQAVGDNRAVGPAADVWALGALLYELLTGRPPFRGATPLETLEQVVGQEPAPPRRLNPQVPRDLEKVCLKCLHKEPALRYPGAAALADDLGRYLAGYSVLARRSTRMERTWRWCRRNPLAAGLLAAVVAALVGGSTTSVWQMTVAQANAARARDNEQKARDEADQTKRVNARLLAAHGELRHALYVSDMNLVPGAYEANNVTLAREILDRHRPRPGDPDERGFEWYYWQRKCHAESASLPTPISLNPSATLSPDGGRLAYFDLGRQQLKVLDAATGEESFSLPCKREGPNDFIGNFRYMCFSADGKVVAALSAVAVTPGRPTRLIVWDLVRRKERTTIRAAFASTRLYTLSPDGRRVAAVVREVSPNRGRRPPTYTGRYFLKVWGGADGKEALSIPLTAEPGSVALSPDGKRLALGRVAGNPGDGRWAGSVRVLNASTGEEVLAIEDPHAYRNAPLFTLAFSADGKQMLASYAFPRDAASPAHAEVRYWDAATGSPLVSASGVPSACHQVAVSPDGKYVTWYGGLWAGNPAFGSEAASAVQVRDASDGTVLATFKGHTSVITSVAYGPGGRLVTACMDGTVKRWQLPEPGRDPGSTMQVVASPDGTRVASANQTLGLFRDTCARSGATQVAQALGARAALGAGPAGTAAQLLATARSSAPDVFRGSVRYEFRVRDSRTGKELFRVGDGSRPVQLQFSPDGKRLAVLLLVGDSANPAATHGEVRVWAVDTGKSLLALNVPLRAPPVLRSNPFAAYWPELRFRPDGRMLALSLPVGEESRGLFVVRAWDADSGREVFTTEAAAYLSQLQFTADGRRLLAAGVGEIRVWDAQTGAARVTVRTGAIIEHLTASRDGSRIAAAVRTPQWRQMHWKVWDTDTGKERVSLPESVDTAVNVALPGLDLSPDGRLLAALSDLASPFDTRILGKIKVWDVQTGELIRTIQGHNARLGAVAFGPDGRRLASAAEGTDVREVKVWDVATGRPLLTLPPPDAFGLFSPKNAFMPPRGRPIRFSPDGGRLIMGRLVESAGVAAGKQWLTVLDATPPAEDPKPEGRTP